MSNPNPSPETRIKKGEVRNPLGRPKGQTLKEYWRERFKNMTDEEKVEFTRKVGNEMIWKMAEGNPKQDTDITSAGEKITPIYGGQAALQEHNSNQEDLQSPPAN